MAVCANLISKSIAVASCDDIVYAGLKPTGYIMNAADIASVTEANGIVTAITMKTGKVAYIIYQMGQQPFSGTNVEMQEGDIMNTFNKVVAFRIYENSPSISQDIVEPLVNGEFVVIVENKSQSATAKNAFEIIGLERGARTTSASQDKYENQSVWSVELTESETPRANKFVFATDYDTTKTMLDALLTVSANSN